jgi:predicted nucleic acid-binding protein
VSAVRFLVDTSAVIRLFRNGRAWDEWEPQVQAGVLTVCPVTELELLYAARSKSERDEYVVAMRSTFAWTPMHDRAFDRAWETQAGLTDRGTHRSAGVVDLLVAATAELNGLVLLHYDRDFDLVAEVTGQTTLWLADPGSIP